MSLLSKKARDEYRGRRRKVDLSPPLLLIAKATAVIGGVGLLVIVADMRRDADYADELAKEFAGPELVSLVSGLYIAAYAVFVLLFVVALQKVRLHNISVRADELANSLGATADDAVTVYRSRIEADARAKLQFEREEWEREREAWKGQETARIYGQVLDQVERGMLHPRRVCPRCGEREGLAS